MYNTDQLILEKMYKQIIQENRFGQGGSRITKAELVSIIKDVEQNHKGTNFFGVTQITRENTKVSPVPVFVLPGLKTNKGRTYFAKVSQVNGQIGYDYAAAVNRQREKETTLQRPRDRDRERERERRRCKETETETERERETTVQRDRDRDRETEGQKRERQK
jgi:hypothetical protein